MKALAGLVIAVLCVAAILVLLAPWMPPIPEQEDEHGG